MKFKQKKQLIDYVSNLLHKKITKDGKFEGYIEQIGTTKKGDTLFISNKPSNLLNPFNGYNQLGVIKTDSFNIFSEKEYVDLVIEKGIIVKVTPKVKGEIWIEKGISGEYSFYVDEIKCICVCVICNQSLESVKKLTIEYSDKGFINLGFKKEEKNEKT